LPDEPRLEPAFAAPQEREAIEGQRRNLLWTAVQALPVDERQIVVLHLEGLSALEIEAITGLSAGAVATRLTRVRQKLAARLRSDTTVDEERLA
jgi:RNA polymerase sigma-70 factor (ECF subfamily)